MDDGTLRERIRTILDTAVADAVTPGAVCRIRVGDGDPVVVAAGRRATHDERGLPLPEHLGAAVTERTVYDLASVTKVVTAVTVLSLVDDGTIDVHAGIGAWLPEYAEGDKARVSVAHLLSHTSGLPPVWPGGWSHVVADYGTPHALWQPPGRERVLRDILGLPLTLAPGTRMDYSCLGYITAMAVAEHATGMPWPRLVADRVLTPLGLHDTTFMPEVARTAPTEYQPELGRGMVRGIVHDETAHALEGVSGNAGLFSTIGDLGALTDALLAGLPGVLSPEAFALLEEDALPGLLGPERAAEEESRIGYGQSLGLRIGQPALMGESPGSAARGHSGFTGTSLFFDRSAGLSVALLTNRVHPHRDRSDVAPLRRAVADAAYAAAARRSA